MAGDRALGFAAPVHRALTEPMLLAGAPRAIALVNGTLAAALGLGLRLWIVGLLVWMVGHGLAVWAARHEQARTVEDVLARRTRALFLNSRAAIEAAPAVADLLARELNRDEAFKARDLEAFQSLAQGYVYQE